MRVRLKGLNTATKRIADGSKKTYYYAWRGGPLLRGEPGTPEFMASYNAALASRVPATNGVLSWLSDKYQDSEDFRLLREKTKKDYARHLCQINVRFGDCPLAVLDDPRVRRDFLEWRDEIARSTPRQADYVIAVLARVLSWGTDRGYLTKNVLERPKRIWKGSRAENVWSEEQEAAFLAVASPELSLAFVIAIETGQRQGDILKLKWSDFDGKTIRLTQSKTGKRLEIDATCRLEEALRVAPRRSVFIVTNEHGKPFTSDGLRASWGKARARAGVRGVTFHDLRGTLVTRMAIAGCTEIEIAAITGHSIRDVKSILEANYLKRDSRIGQAAIRKYEAGTKSSNHTSNRSSKSVAKSG